MRLRGIELAEVISQLCYPICRVVSRGDRARWQGRQYDRSWEHSDINRVPFQCLLGLCPGGTFQSDRLHPLPSAK
jgi:hypothetical protein